MDRSRDARDLARLPVRHRPRRRVLANAVRISVALALALRFASAVLATGCATAIAPHGSDAANEATTTSSADEYTAIYRPSGEMLLFMRHDVARDVCVAIFMVGGSSAGRPLDVRLPR